jgi:hypothetical protein
MPRPTPVVDPPAPETPIETLRSACAAMAAWVDQMQGAADPTAVLGDSLKTVAWQLERVEKALRAIPQDAAEQKAWQTAIVEYRAALAAMKPQLEHIEMVLRIRAAGIKRRRAKANAVAHWADLTAGIHSSRIF